MKYIEEIRKHLFYAGLNADAYKRIKKDIRKSNVRNLITFSGIALIFLFLMFLFSFVIPNIAPYRWYYFFSLILISILYFLSKYVPLGDTYVQICVYVFVGVLFGFGCILGTVAVPEEQAVTFVALLLTVPLLYTDRPIRMMLMIFLSIVVFVIMAVIYKEPSVYVTDILNTVVFGIISAIISTYMMKVKCHSFFYEREIDAMSRIDLLTGLYNRNAFEQRLSTYPGLCRQTLFCLYADANGLHELNNRFGHEAGDQMLKCIAEIMKSQFRANDVYRIGGDEFVAFAMDSDIGDFIRRTEAIKAAATEKGYPISIGYDMQNVTALRMEVLIKNAETNMYDEKRRYYEQLGKTDSMRSRAWNT